MEAKAKPKRKRTLRIKLKRRSTEAQQKVKETKIAPPPPVAKPEPQKLVLKIKANGVQKTVDFVAAEHPENPEEDFDSDSSYEDFEPVPTWGQSQSGGKTLKFENARKRTYHDLSEEEEPERSATGRLKRRRNNIEGKKTLSAYGWTLEIVTIVGHQTRKKKVLELVRTGLKGGFVSGMANSAQKDGFLATLEDTSGQFRAAGIFHIEHCGRSLSYTCLSVFVTDPRYQKQGLGRMLAAFIIQQSIEQQLEIVVLARPEAVPFWTNTTIGFREMTKQEQVKYGRPTKLKRTRKKKDDLVDLLYDGPREDLISMALLRFRPSEDT